MLLASGVVTRSSTIFQTEHTNRIQYCQTSHKRKTGCRFEQLFVYLSIYLFQPLFFLHAHSHIYCLSLVLGNPIANDPCYGGELFYNDAERRKRAIEVLREMRRDGKHPLSKVPHLGDPELDNPPPSIHVPPHMESANGPGSGPADLLEEMTATVTSIDNTIMTSPTIQAHQEISSSVEVGQTIVVQSSSNLVDGVQSNVSDDALPTILPNKLEIEKQGEAESDHQYLVRTCR